MKARCHPAAPTKISSSPERGLDISPQKNVFTFEAGMLLKTKVGKMANGFAPNEFMKIKELSYFPDDFMIQKELAAIFTSPPNAIGATCVNPGLDQSMGREFLWTKSRKTIARFVLFSARIS